MPAHCNAMRTRSGLRSEISMMRARTMGSETVYTPWRFGWVTSSDAWRGVCAGRRVISVVVLEVFVVVVIGFFLFLFSLRGGGMLICAVRG